jgi:hypothetical protein
MRAKQKDPWRRRMSIQPISESHPRDRFPAAPIHYDEAHRLIGLQCSRGIDPPDRVAALLENLVCAGRKDEVRASHDGVIDRLTSASDGLRHRLKTFWLYGA